MIIRLATPADTTPLGRLHIDCWRAAYHGLVPDAYLAALDPERRADRFRESLAEAASETYLAEEYGEVLGFLTLGACRDPDLDPETAGEIYAIYLGPKHWRRGVGRRLCQHGEELLRTQGYTQAILWVFEGNPRARCFYEVMGFRPDGACKTLNPGALLQAIRYRKNLEEMLPSAL